MLLMKRNSYESIANPPKQSEETAEISKRVMRNLGWSEAVEKFEENCKRLAPPTNQSESPWNPVDCL